MNTMANPARRLEAVTPSDSAILTGVRAVYVGGGGSIAIRARGNSTAVTLAAVPAGTFLPIEAVQVMATGTTATSIVAWY